MSPATQDVFEQLVADLTRSGRWWGDPPRLSVDDFGYQAISIVEADSDIAINIPSGTSIGEPSVFGLPVGTGSDGVTETLTAGDGRLEICCVGPTGRLLAPDAPEVTVRMAHAAAAARRAWLAREDGSAIWAASRLKHLSSNRITRYPSLLSSPNLVGDTTAAATAGLPQEAWDEHAAFLQAHVTDSDPRAYWHALVRLNDEGVLVAPECLLIFSRQRWSGSQVDALAQAFAVPIPAVEGGLGELKALGLVDWPAPLEIALGTIPMADIRSAFGPRGIKGQSRAVIVTRALEILGEAEVRSIAQEMEIDLSQPALTERGLSFMMQYDAPDPRCERLRLMAQREVRCPPLSGLPDDFGRRAITIGWEAAGPVDRFDDSLIPDGEAADLHRMMEGVIDLAGHLLQRPRPPSDAIAAVQAGAMTLIDMLGDAAQRLSGDEG